eukprot:3984432-Prymnesium_polylepis.1
MLRPVFPAGVPSRLLIVGAGGRGKTVLTKQIALECCCSVMGATTAAAADEMGAPLRFALPQLLQHLGAEA